MSEDADTTDDRTGDGATVVADVEPLFDYPVRDTSICRGPDDTYYLTGTTGAPDWWGVTGDLRVWQSPDLERWEPVVTEPRERSVVWSVDRQGTWQRQIQERDGAPFRPLWAPEIHYLRDTFWITYSIPWLGNGVLKSTSGEARGPYESAIEPDLPISGDIDASLFEDDDGTVYFVCGNGKIAPMNEELTGITEDLTHLAPANAEEVGFEGAFLFRAAGRYHLAAADFVDGDYHCYVASADDLYGPYGDRYLAIPHGGHNVFFRDAAGDLWSTFFGNDENAPFRERPAALRVEFDDDGRIRPLDT
ncbi:family 43 glycosylhydrolase [Halosimplex salinum]|uniref:family 43 glycosylhydrolase n=1 Tax=Halosimplex salinum TaxID=1710538 RepID=UPI000F485BB2|nr:family 43 glycosylhydrolase [Halosimplex salinum]